MVRSAKRQKNVEERRGALRADRVFAINHRLHQKASKKASFSWSLSNTKNMSATGLLFLSEVSYKCGDILDVSVTMSGIVDIVKSFAKVVRVNEKSANVLKWPFIMSNVSLNLEVPSRINKFG